jgi:molybdopterin converting factor small subunit
MKIRIKAFATVREACGFDDKELIVSDGISVKKILQELEKCHPGLKDFDGSLLFAINEAYCSRDSVLSDEDILAIFPPVSGG